jgi:hypothetical protein
MSTKNIVDGNVVSPGAVARQFAIMCGVRLAGTVSKALTAGMASLELRLSRFTSSMFTEYEASPALMPLLVRNTAVRNEKGRNRSWR